MRVVFDIDGVLANFEKNVVLVANNLWPGKLPYNYVPQDWDYSDKFIKEDWAKVWEQIKLIPDFWLRQPPIPDAILAFKKFRKQHPEVPIYFITARMATGGNSAVYQTQLWLMKYGLITYKEANNVIAVNKPVEKLKHLKELNIDIMIDDHGPTVKAQNEAGVKTYLLRQPWNREYTDLPIVQSVEQFCDILSKTIESDKVLL